MIRVFNTLGKKKEDFKPRKGKKVNLFVCGPTVYDLSHIGHARTYISYDMIVNYLRYKKYKVFFLMNITDIDDKIISRARSEGKDPLVFSDHFTKEFFKDLKALGINSINQYAKASNHIKDILRQIKGLQQNGFVYELDDGLYFSVSKFEEYGKLSGRKQSDESQEEAVSKIDENIGKEDPRDFCVWKFPKPGDPKWDTEIGSGRPGWHIEDTAIAEHWFKEPQYDMHGGAKDLIFPHHEAEVSLMEAYSGKKPFVKYWVHTGFLTVEGEKMGKSKGNFILIRDALQKWDKDTLRFMFLSTKYSSSVDYSEASLAQAKSNLVGIRNAYASMNGKKSGGKYIKQFEEYMNDDFNTPRVVALLLEMSKSKENVRTVYDKIGKVLGISFKPEKKKPLPKALKDLIKERESARKNKDWAVSDRIRDQLALKGIILSDTPKGTEWNWA